MSQDLESDCPCKGNVDNINGVYRENLKCCLQASKSEHLWWKRVDICWPTIHVSVASLSKRRGKLNKPNPDKPTLLYTEDTIV